MIWDLLGLEVAGQFSHSVVSNIVDPPSILWIVA
jgi:hypothetical protein